MNYIASALINVFSPMGLVFNAIGVILGIIFGALPGLNGVVGVALLLPLTYSIAPEYGLIMLSGLYMGSTYGGSISAILLNCPGTGEAACTALNGNPMARDGKAKEALYYSLFASAIGGIFGSVIMLCFTPVLARIALKFGPPELFLVSVMGLAVVGSLMGKSFAKGMFSVAFGLILSIVGMDATSVNFRFTFNNMYLQSGLSLIPVSVGLFAIAEMFDLISKKDDSMVIAKKFSNTKAITVAKDMVKRSKILLKSSIIGTIIGILPGTGGAIATFIAYGEAKRSSKESEMFGKGSPDGIIAPESANNAAVGGSFVPLLSLGIPGSATSAIIFGALTVHGMIPGPKLFSEHADTVYALMIGLIISVVIMVIVGILGTNLFSKILKIKTKYIIPAVLAFSILGAFSARNSIFDIGVAIAFGLIGLLFKRASIPIAPTILGMILGSMAEQNLRQAIVIASAKSVNLFSFIVFRPVSIVLISLIALLLAGNMKIKLREKE